MRSNIKANVWPWVVLTSTKYADTTVSALFRLIFLKPLLFDTLSHVQL